MIGNKIHHLIDNQQKKGFPCLDFLQQENGFCGLG